MKMKPKFENGQKVIDVVTGFKGTIACVAIYMNGCIRYSIQPELDDEGHFQESQVIDEQQLELIESPKKKKKEKKKGGYRKPLPKFKL
jgi:hypothetical protein